LTRSLTNQTNGRKEPRNKHSCLFVPFAAIKNTHAPKTTLNNDNPSPGRKTGTDENGRPSTDNPSFTDLRRRAGVFMSAVSGAREARETRKLKKGENP
jgi:hypothetical protein